jgi:hypothetical protein
MKRVRVFLVFMILSIGAFTAFSNEAGPQAMQQMPSISDMAVEHNAGSSLEMAATSSETKAMNVENHADLLKARVKEIRDMDKSELSAEERDELRRELQETQEVVRGPGIYIGAGTLLLIVILILILR